MYIYIYFTYICLLTGLRHISWTRYNLCPRVRRTLRKSSVLALIATVIIPVAIFVLTIYVNEIMSKTHAIDNKLVDELQSNNTSLSKTNRCLCSNASSLECQSYCHLRHINDFHRKYCYKIIILSAVICSCLCIVLSIMTCRYFVRVLKWQQNIHRENESTETQATHEGTHLCTSLQIQIIQDDLCTDSDIFVDASDILV